MNQCHFQGRLTRDPDLRSTQNGKSVVNLSIAVNRTYKQGTQTKKEVAFLECEAWDTGADVINKFFKKGDAIIVHASVKQDDWEDSEGKKRKALRFRINSFDFPAGNSRLSEQGVNDQSPTNDSEGQEEKKSPPAKAKPKKAAEQEEDDGSIPF